MCTFSSESTLSRYAHVYIFIWIYTVHRCLCVHFHLNLHSPEMPMCTYSSESTLSREAHVYIFIWIYTVQRCPCVHFHLNIHCQEMPMCTFSQTLALYVNDCGWSDTAVYGAIHIVIRVHKSDALLVLIELGFTPLSSFCQSYHVVVLTFVKRWKESRPSWGSNSQPLHWQPANRLQISIRDSWNCWILLRNFSVCYNDFKSRLMHIHQNAPELPFFSKTIGFKVFIDNISLHSSGK